MVNLNNWQSPCSIDYVINRELHEALITGNYPGMDKYEKIPCWNIPGIWLVRFGIIYDKNIPKLVMNYLFYPELFTDSLLLYLIGRHKFKESIPFLESGGFYTFIDKNLTENKKGLIKDLVNSPNKYNEYFLFDKDKEFDIDINHYYKKRVYIKNIDDMNTLLLSAFMKDNKVFLNKLSEDFLDSNLLEETGILDANLLKDCLFVVKDLNGFIDTINKKYNIIITQGSKKWRGSLNSMNSFLGSLDLDFRYNLRKYNNYHIYKGTIPLKLKIPSHKFTYKNIHNNLGISRW